MLVLSTWASYRKKKCLGPPFSGEVAEEPPVTPVMDEAMLAVLEAAAETEVNTCCQMRSLLSWSKLLKFVVARLLCFVESCCLFLHLERMGLITFVVFLWMPRLPALGHLIK